MFETNSLGHGLQLCETHMYKKKQLYFFFQGPTVQTEKIKQTNTTETTENKPAYNITNTRNKTGDSKDKTTYKGS